MAGFRKAKAMQAALKIGVYGKSGSGKTFTSLLIGEGLAKHTGKRLAFVDTERGTDYYSLAVPARKVHPEAFDFDALYTRSLTEVLEACRNLNAKEHGCLVIDSMTHLWETAIQSYGGKTGADGQIPMHAWSKIKKPYKALMQWMLQSPLHVIICGRQGMDYGEDPSTGELVVRGYKMKAEGETQYEPHVLLRMEDRKHSTNDAVITAWVEKDRTGVLQGQTIEWPTFDSIAAPMLGLLGEKQDAIDADAAALQDAEAHAIEEGERSHKSEKAKDDFLYRMKLAKTKKEVDAISKEITPALKKEMLTEHVTELREAYQERLSQLSA